MYIYRRKKQKCYGAFKGVNRQTSKKKQKGGWIRHGWTPFHKKYGKRKQRGGGFGIGMAAGMALPLLTSFLGGNRKLGFGGK